MNWRNLCSAMAMLGIGAASLLAPQFSSEAIAQAWRFHLEEATIADVHRAIRARQITATPASEPLFQAHRSVQRGVRQRRHRSGYGPNARRD